MAVTVVNPLPTNYVDDVFTGDRLYDIQADSESGYSTITDMTEYSQEGSPISAADLNAITAAINRLNTVATDITLSSGSWSGSSAPYTQTVTGLTGMTESSNPSFAFTGTTAAQFEAYTYLSKCVPGTNQVTFYCYGDKPTTNIPIWIKGF